MRIRKLVLLCFCGLAVLCAGCNGSRETDQVAFIIDVGVDAAPDGQLAITYRLAAPKALAGESGGGGGGGPGKKPSILITIIAPSLAEGRSLLNSTTSRAPSMSHITAFIIGEELARQGIGDFVGGLARFREFRGSMFLLLVRGGTAREFMSKNDPELETLASTWVESMFATYGESSYYLPANIHEFYKRLKGGSGAPYISAVAIDDLTGTDKAEKGPVAGDKTKEYLAGQVPRQGSNPATLIGTAVFREDKLAGYLTDSQTRALATLLGKLRLSFYALQDPLEPQKVVNVNTRLGRSPRIDVDVSSDIPVIHVSIFLEGEISAIPSGIMYESPEYLPLLENQLSTVVNEQLTEMLQLTQEWGTDVVNFGYHARPKFNTIEEFEAYHWNAKYSQAIIDLKVESAIRRTGLMRKTTPIRRD